MRPMHSLKLRRLAAPGNRHVDTSQGIGSTQAERKFNFIVPYYHIILV